MAIITPNIDQIIKDPDATVIRITYTDGVSIKISKEYRLTNFDLESFKNIVRNDISQLSAVGTVDQKISQGPFDPTATPISNADKSRAKFISDLFLQRQMEKAIMLNFMTVNDKAYTDQVSLVTSEFINPDYLPFL